MNEQSPELPYTSEIEYEILNALRNQTIFGSSRMKVKKLAKRINADPDDVIGASENLQKRGIVTMSYDSKRHRWNVEFTQSGLQQFVRAEAIKRARAIKFSTQARKIQSRHSET
ncbi:hypothetical protein [Corynebacterium glucuronolyticum]|uniref:hypothetical protein n=1 Tax=Corynebacterium glucuronolyticum TaxID=39791 RepID=UPI00019C2063|nr:hypothetical protein [Corynebacterium glucuronolyticum]EEI27898.1 hypothetical protein HMPREF0294_0512 [Corynebacterium glucuronolyticum ATCC 51867]QRO81944.1 hypothetical protein I6J20_08680 [Corynebacterium glucuronolyticum]